MKKSIISLVILLAGISFAFTQPSLELVWKKYMYPTKVDFAKFSNDGNLIYCAVGNNISVMDSKTGEFLTAFDNSGITHTLSDFQISTNGETISTALLGEGAAIWDTKQNKILRKFKPDSTINNESSWIECTSVYPNGKFALFGQITLGNKPTSDAKTSIILFDIEQGKEVQRIQQSVRINQIQISHDGRFFVTGSTVKNFDNTYNDQLLLWDAVTFQQIAVLENVLDEWVDPGYRQITFSKDDKYLGFIRKSYKGPYVVDINQRINIRESEGIPSVYLGFLNGNSYYYVSHGIYGTSCFNTDVKNYKNYNPEFKTDLIESVINDKNEQYVLYISDSLELHKITMTDIIQTPIQSVVIQPIGNVLVIRNESREIIGTKILIIDITGKILYTEELFKLDNNEKKSLNLNLPSGIYICKITAGDREYTQKFEIVR
jgi:WD40 repeat protein